MKLRFAVLGLVLVLLAFISERSGYSIHGDVQTINWDVVLMLSPWGLIKSFVIEPTTYLRPYYFEASGRGELFRDPVLMTLIVLNLAVALGGLYLVRYFSPKWRR